MPDNAYGTDLTNTASTGFASSDPAPVPSTGPVKLPGVSPLALTPGQDAAVPEPPAGYKPGPLSPVRHAYEDNILYKIGTVLSSYGEQLPTNMKIKMAQQKADAELDANKLGWDNYYKNNAIVRDTLQSHLRDSMHDFFAVLPNMKAQLTAIDRAKDPEGFNALLEHFSNSAESMYKGGYASMQYIGKNLASVYDADDLLSDTDPSISEPARKMVNQMGYTNWLSSKERESLSLARNQSRLNSGQLRLPADDLKLLSTGKMPEEKFRTSYKQSLFDQQVRPVAVAAAMHFLDTPEGKQRMNAMGVSTDDMSYKQELKHKEQSYTAQQKDEDLRNAQAIIAHKKEFPNSKVYSDQELKDALYRRDVRLGNEKPQSAPGQFSENNQLAPYMMEASRGEFHDPVQMMSTVDRTSREGTRRLGILNSALRLQKESGPAGARDVKMDTLVDTNKNPVYKLGKDGYPMRVQGRVTEEAYRAGEAGFTMTNKQREQMAELKATGTRGLELFDEADKAFKGTSAKDKTAEVSAEYAASNKLTGVFSAQFYPKIHNYVANRDSALGKFARSLGGEVGVLTDQDVARVVKMFSTAGDTAVTRAAKKKAFSRLVELNRSAITGFLQSGEGDLSTIKAQHKDSVNGILGSVEDMSRRDQAAMQPSGAKSLAEPSEANTGNRGESLLEKMKKGK